LFGDGSGEGCMIGTGSGEGCMIGTGSGEGCMIGTGSGSSKGNNKNYTEIEVKVVIY
jgi:hypothetical protein